MTYFDFKKNYLSSLSSLRKIALVLCLLLWICIPASAIPGINFDYDGKSDISIFRGGIWWGLNSESNTVFVIHWGLISDVIAPGDYDGDGLTDLTVFRPDTGVWYSRRSSNGQLFAVQWGKAFDLVVPADYDGDGQTDFAVFRPDDGVWYILTTTSGYRPRYFRWGKFGDTPVPADYDGDGKDDIAVYRKTEDNWYIVDSSTGIPRVVNFGYGGCCIGRTPVPADYTGDRKADLAHYSPDGFWFIKRSEDGVVVSREFGIIGDPPIHAVPGDYDGDHKTDLGIFHRGKWYTYRSSTSTQVNYDFGVPFDKPLQSIYFRSDNPFPF